MKKFIGCLCIMPALTILIIAIYYSVKTNLTGNPLFLQFLIATIIVAVFLVVVKLTAYGIYLLTTPEKQKGDANG